MTSYLVTAWSSSDPLGLPLGPPHSSFSAAQHQADSILIFTGQPCRVFRLDRLYLTHPSILLGSAPAAPGHSPQEQGIQTS